MRIKIGSLILFILVVSCVILIQSPAFAFTVQTSTIVFKGFAGGRIRIITSPIVFMGWQGGHISVITSKIVYPWVSIPSGALWNPNQPHREENDSQLQLSPRISAPKLNQPTPWHPGENHSVSWHSTSVPGRVRIFLVRGKNMAALLNANRFAWSPPGGVANSGYWRRNLPKNLPPDEHYRVLIQSMEHPDISGFSEFFPVRLKMNTAAFNGMKNKHPARIPAGAHIQLQQKPATLPTTAASSRKVTFLKLTSPHGMETWFIGETHPVTWKASGIEGRIRIVLEDRNGKRQTLNGLAGTDVQQGRFNWKISSTIKPGSMYKIFLKTADGKVKSNRSGGFNIKMKLIHGPIHNES